MQGLRKGSCVQGQGQSILKAGFLTLPQYTPPSYPLPLSLRFLPVFVLSFPLPFSPVLYSLFHSVPISCPLLLSFLPPFSQSFIHFLVPSSSLLPSFSPSLSLFPSLFFSHVPWLCLLSLSLCAKNRTQNLTHAIHINHQQSCSPGHSLISLNTAILYIISHPSTKLL